jgi:hypothetical protein
MAGMATRYGETLNEPPVAMCMAFTGSADMDCCLQVAVADIDDGSYDPQGMDDVESVCITAVDGVPVDCEQSVEVCGTGDHAVTLTITDTCGETSSCDAIVTVIDDTPPDLEIVLNRDVLWPPNHKMAEILATVTAQDNCDASPMINLVSVASNEPDNGIGDGNTVDDIVIIDDMNLLLRSERAGGGDGRIYTITYMATDYSGNTTVGTTEVRVPHDQSGTALAYTGFQTDGTALDVSARTFALVIPSVPQRIDLGGDETALDLPEALDATTLDPGQVYLGNTDLCLRPLASELVDVDRNGLKDLVVHYSTKALTRFADLPAVGVENAERIEFVADAGDPVGLHYRAGEIDYLVSDIFTLGPPLIVDLSSWQEGKDAAGPANGDAALNTEITSIQPNPFNPMTRIRFNVGSTSRVVLRIYDFRGTLVRELRNEVMPPGPHEAVWDGRDQQGRPAAAGVYLSRLVNGRSRSTHKLVLLK